VNTVRLVAKVSLGVTSTTKMDLKSSPIQEFTPTVCENWVTEAKFEGIRVELSVWDTAGQEDYEVMRRLSYHEANVILICYSPDMRDSLENVEAKWVPEICHLCPGVPFLLICCRNDLKGDTKTIENLKKWGETMISAEEGAEMANNVSASAHMECSAKSGFGIQEVFEAAAQLAFRIAPTNARERQQKCLIL
jgi:Ras homolog gene family, member A